jgi:hypothetical protein
VSSNSECPSAEAVSAHLLGLLPTGGPENAAARVRSDGQSMRIDLSAPGEETQQRSLFVDGDCKARAELAAYVIASWLDAMPVGTLKAPGIPPREPRPLASSSTHFFDPEGEPLSISTRTVVGAGVLGQNDTLGTVAGGLLVVGMPSLIEQTGWLFESSLASSRQLSVGQGTVSFRRPTFTLALTYNFYGKRWAIRGRLGGSLGVLMASGSGFAPNNSTTTVMWGLNAGLALTRRWHRHEWWLGLDTTGWPQGRRILTRVGNAGTVLSKELPSWDLRFVLGYAFAIL